MRTFRLLNQINNWSLYIVFCLSLGIR